ncbi:hypothetical protein IJS18_01400 [Candidatus Saccharibacteria bacterium]|nr:hypothetical protein [Candidatus Saccharibacteria bacterium]
MDGFSKDGYLIDQNLVKRFKYRTIRACLNCCGPAAVYNIRHYLGDKTDFHTILKEMDHMFIVRVPGPTTMNVMRSYLKKCLPAMEEFTGREEAFKASCSSRAGILRYKEGNTRHFIAFIKKGKEYRFLNVYDGGEDFTDTMESFFKNHVPHRYYTSVFIIK